MTRVILLACGWLFFALGVMGAFLPILPTTPFMLLSAACFVRSSERIHAWLLAHPRYGKQITDYFEGKGLRRNTKIVAIVTLWGSVLASAHFFVPYWYGDVAMVLVAAGVSTYLLRLPTAPPSGRREE